MGSRDRDNLMSVSRDPHSNACRAGGIPHSHISHFSTCTAQRVWWSSCAMTQGEYFDKRRLKRYAGVFHLWALGVAAVISGNFFGWNYGLEWGFWSMFVATVVMAVIYFGLIFAIAELSASIRETGAAYVFARAAMGPLGGFLAGLAESVEYVLSVAIIVAGMADYLNDLLPSVSQPWWWAVSYVLFGGLNIWGAEASFIFTIFITFVAMAVLVVFYIASIPKLNFAKWASSSSSESISAVGVLRALPFALWFFLGIEGVPLASEESLDPSKDVPMGAILGMLTMAILSFITLFVNSSVPPGIDALSTSGIPLGDGLKGVLGEGVSSSLLSLVALTGLMTSFHSLLFATGRQIYSLSRMGYYPKFLSLTLKEQKTPYVALIATSAIGWVVAATLHFSSKDSPLVPVLLNMALFGALISYALQLVSFIILRVRFPNKDRPFKSPIGPVGVCFVLGLVLVTFGSLFLSEDSRKGLIGVVIWYVLGIVYYALHGRHQLLDTWELESYLETNEGKEGTLLEASQSYLEPKEGIETEVAPWRDDHRAEGESIPL